MKNFSQKITAFALMILMSTGIASAQNQTRLIDSLITQTNRLGLFNGNVMVVEGCKVIYKNAIGFDDASKRTKLTTDYRFHIGSIAKEFNAVGIMMLQEQGKLNIDDKVSKYLPQLPQWADKIRIRNLLQYTSGVPDVKWETAKNDADDMADLLKLDKLDFEPGTQYAYNNNNVFLQRRIIEKLSGLSFNEFVRERILKPCGMTNSVVDPTNNDKLVAKAFDDNGKQDPLTVPISGWTAVTLDDFYKWAQSLEQFKLIGPVSIKVLVTPFTANRQDGLGGGSMEGDKLITHVHDGTAYNYQALLVQYTPKGRTVILLTNNKQGNLYGINTAIQNILDGKPYVTPKKSMSKLYGAVLDTMSGQHVIDFYKKLKTEHPTEYGFDDEATLNEIGYSLLGHNIDAAITVFEYNTVLFPKSGNVFDSLGEAYLKKGDKQKALVNYKRSFQLDPSNDNAKAVIAELEK